VNEILKKLGLEKDDTILGKPDVMLKDQHPPIWNSVKLALGLEFTDDGPYYAGGKRFEGVDEYISFFLDFLTR
jgi:hypothetical protein